MVKDESRFYVYALRVDGEENPFYIGKGQGNRAIHHFTPSSLKKNSHKNNKIKKARLQGKEVKIEYFETGLTNEQACEKEREYIAKYGRWDTEEGGVLANRTDGGEGTLGIKPTEETRRKMSEAQKKRPQRPWKGKSLSEEHKRKIGEGVRGNVVSEETKSKISAANTGMKRSEETKEKMRQAAKNRGPRKKTGPRSEEVKQKLRQSALERHRLNGVSQETKNKLRAAAMKQWHGENHGD
jgi:hypothetical protein